jgi:hypothetical protein
MMIDKVLFSLPAEKKRKAYWALDSRLSQLCP